MKGHIITECYIDTMVVEIALDEANGCNHQKGCNNVARIMQSKLQDKFAIGIIDDDKHKDLKHLISAIKHSKNAYQLVQWIECLSTNPHSPQIDLL
jgi:hypothetical protein